MNEQVSNSQLSYIYNFPDPAATLKFALAPLQACFDDGLVVLDANVLLLPLGTGAHTLDAIEEVYLKLAKERRIYVPRHALREYFVNRPTKIKELFDQLIKKKERDYKPSSSPLLQKAKCFKEFSDAESALHEASKKVSKLILTATQEIKDWENNDPVTQMYRKVGLFSYVTPDPVDFSDKSAVLEFEAEHKDRKGKRIPPGYKDSEKDINDIGDFLIWKTVLDLGKRNSGRNLTFVSGETKSDWVYRSASQTLYAREELIEEYRRASNGGSFHLIDFATLLQLANASAEVVDEVRLNEVISAMSALRKSTEEALSGVTLKWIDFVPGAKAAVGQWLISRFREVRNDVEGLDYIAIDAVGTRYLIQVRPIRHVEHFQKRVAEITPGLINAVKAERLRGSTHVMGVIVFVCENSNSSDYIFQSRTASDQDLMIQVGYMDGPEFRLSDGSSI